jgi:hypothetical protein
VSDPAARAYQHRQARRAQRDAGADQDAEARLRGDYQRLQLAGLLRRELRALLGDEKERDDAAELAKRAAAGGPLAETADGRLAGRRAHAALVLELADRHDLRPWLRLAEIRPEDRAALGLPDA